MVTERTQTLKNKRILITAGPTWVPIDKVRVISNIATGKTGVLLAQRLRDLGARVTLLLGPVETCCLDRKIKIVHFRFFDELKDRVTEELRLRKYDAVIHSAAVSDFRPRKIYPFKISSQKKNLLLSLKPTIKIIDRIKKIDRALFLVAFKFEPVMAKERLIKGARRFLKEHSCNLVVANSVADSRYVAYIVEEHSVSGPILSKEGLAKDLINTTSCKL